MKNVVHVSEFFRCKITRLQLEVDEYKEERELQEQRIRELEGEEKERELAC